MTLQVKIIRTGALSVNASVVYDDETNECVAVDVGDFAPIENFIDENGLMPKMVFATHGHFDHIAGAKEFCNKYDCRFAMSSLDWAHISPLQIDDVKAYAENCGYPDFCPPYKIDLDLNLVNGVLPFGIQVIKTPGHSAGGVCLYISQIATLLSGDTLFYETIGRTDLVDGDYDLLLKSIRKNLFVLPEDTFVVPGHGKFTKIRHEKKDNPFLQTAK